MAAFSAPAFPERRGLVHRRFIDILMEEENCARRGMGIALSISIRTMHADQVVMRKPIERIRDARRHPKLESHFVRSDMTPLPPGNLPRQQCATREQMFQKR